MEKRKVLDNISQNSIEKMIPCFKPITKNFNCGEEIISYINEHPKNICLMSKGKASLNIIDENGNNFVLEKYEKGDIFGDIFSLKIYNYQSVVVADSDCTVIYIDYNHLIQPCENLCHHHSQFISNLFIMAAQKSRELSLHISVLGQPSIRKKILFYFSHLENTSNNNSVQLPMSLVELSSYLCVDRAAMMREIKAMKNEKIISGSKRNYILFKK